MRSELAIRELGWVRVRTARTYKACSEVARFKRAGGVSSSWPSMSNLMMVRAELAAAVWPFWMIELHG